MAELRLTRGRYLNWAADHRSVTIDFDSIQNTVFALRKPLSESEKAAAKHCPEIKIQKQNNKTTNTNQGGFERKKTFAAGLTS